MDTDMATSPSSMSLLTSPFASHAAPSSPSYCPYGWKPVGLEITSNAASNASPPSSSTVSSPSFSAASLPLSSAMSSPLSSTSASPLSSTSFSPSSSPRSVASPQAVLFSPPAALFQPATSPKSAASPTSPSRRDDDIVPKIRSIIARTSQNEMGRKRFSVNADREPQLGCFACSTEAISRLRLRRVSRPREIQNSAGVDQKMSAYARTCDVLRCRELTTGSKRLVGAQRSRIVGAAM